MMQLAMGDKLVTLDDLKAVYDSVDGGGGGSGGVYIVHADGVNLDKTAGEIIAAARNKLVILLEYSVDDADVDVHVGYLTKIKTSNSADYLYRIVFASADFVNGHELYTATYNAGDADSYPYVPVA